jgi:hypothetical protein
MGFCAANVTYADDSSDILSFASGGLVLQAGQTIQTAGYTLGFQGDGNIVVTDPGGTPVWNSGTAGNDCSNCQLTFQPDGNLLARAADGSVIWESKIRNSPGAVLYFGNADPYLYIAVPDHVNPSVSADVFHCESFDSQGWACGNST